MEETRNSQGYSQGLLDSLSQMRHSQQLTDLSILIGDQEKVFHVHKCVMVAASKHFAALVNANQLEDSHCLIRGLDEELWRTLLDFIYTGQLRLSVDSCLTLHSTAEQLGIAEAVRLCEQYMQAHSILPEQDEAGEAEAEEGKAHSVLGGIKREDHSADTELSEEAERSPGQHSKSVKQEQEEIHLEITGEDFCTVTDEGVKKPVRRRIQSHHLDRNDQSGDSSDPDFNPLSEGSGSKLARKRKSALSRLQSGSSDSEAEEASSGQRKRRRAVTRTGSDSLKLQLRHTARKPTQRRTNYSFTKYGRFLDVPADDSVDSVRRMPLVQCRACQQRFFCASSLPLHYLYKHHVPLAHVRRARRVNTAKRACAVTKAILPTANHFRCTLCQANFASRPRALCHMARVHTARSMRCVRCHERLGSKLGRRHLCKGARALQPLPALQFCRHCPRHFKHTAALEQHYLEHHPDEDCQVDLVCDVGFTCRHCARTFVRLGAYLVHLCAHGLSDKEVDLEFTDPGRVPLRCTVSCEPDSQHVDMPYKCPDCAGRFASARSLDLHMMNKHNKRIAKATSRSRPNNRFHCQEGQCDALFSRMLELRRHVTRAHPSAVYSCPHCKYSTNIKAKFHHHVENRHGSDVAERTCPHCQRVLDKKQRLRIHLVAKHGIKDPSVKEFKCTHPDCSYVAFTRYGLETHQQRHTRVKAFPCNICHKLFKTEKGAERHVQKLHLGVRPWICETCAASYATEAELKKHRLRHGDSKQFKCQHCDYATHDKGNLQSHVFSKHERFKDQPQSSGSRKVWTCEICGYRCDLPHRIQEHKDSHSGTKRHQCTLCNQAFVARYSLNYHMKKVHQGLKFECEHCSFTAPTISKLNFHKRTKHTHVGVKPFKCYYCDFHSASSGNVNKHVKKKHPGQRFKWVKVGTFDTLPPYHELKNAGLQPSPIAVKENQGFIAGSTGVASMEDAVATSNEQFYLMTEYVNEQPVVRLLSKQQLSELNTLNMAHTGAGVSTAGMALQSLSESDGGAPTLELGSAEELQVLDEHQGAMQVLYMPGGVAMSEEPGGSQAQQMGVVMADGQMLTRQEAAQVGVVMADGQVLSQSEAGGGQQFGMVMAEGQVLAQSEAMAGETVNVLMADGQILTQST